MKPDQDVTTLFNKFAGREVLSPINSGHDPVIKSMEKLAAANGMCLRVWFPNMMGTMDYRTDRVNAHVERGADGKYRLSKEFTIG